MGQPLERPYRAVASAESAIAAIADYTAGYFEHTADLVVVGMDIGSADQIAKSVEGVGYPSTHAFWEDFVNRLVERGVLRTDIDVVTTAATLSARASPRLFRVLRRERGWPAAKYRDWLTLALTVYLLDP
ncbi:hypothetical protein [Nocardia crassostreae]|uniref:hypothetical protein n=1 Tax=Nocardia crassostreae TaxID=53428 RepID=UPI00082C3E9E|nr:hypothetical protein [Nocardia crassostreae]